MATSKLVFGITKIVPKRQEDTAGFDLMALTFAEAYAELRRACPRGDLIIHLSIEANTAAEVGVKLEPARARCARCSCLAAGEWRQKIGLNASLFICYRCLPAEWRCPYCGYGEYKNREDWERRAANHVETHSDEERGLACWCSDPTCKGALTHAALT